MAMLGANCSGCCCGRCVVPPHVVTDFDGSVTQVRSSYAEPRWRTQAECERCRMCVESLSTECNGGCPGGSRPLEPLVALEFSSEECGSGGGGNVTIGCGTILSATVTNGGSGYAKIEFSEPTLTATATGGTGGVLSISGYTKLVGGTFDGYYVPAGITVTSGGSGYTDNAQVTLSLGTDDEWAPGSGAPDITIRTKADPPADEWTLTSYSQNGSGLVVSLTLARRSDVPGYGPLFEATAATVVDGGADYEVGDELDAVGSTTDPDNPAVLSVTSVDGDGAVTGLSVLSGGYHEGTDTGVISSVVITSGRPARKRTVSTCPVTVTVAQQAPSNGTGATITATVDSTLDSPTFGKVTGLTVTNGGSGFVSLCEKKTAVVRCEDCQESATCDDTGGCPCGTWVVGGDGTACECCKWTNPEWGVAIMNIVDADGAPINYLDSSEDPTGAGVVAECAKLRNKVLLIRSHFEAAGWTVTLDEEWCPPNALDVWGNVYPFLASEEPCECGFLFRAECESCNRAYPAHIWTPAYTFLVVDDPELGLRTFEARPFDLSQWVAMPVEDWENDVPGFSEGQVISIWPPTNGGFARVVYCEHSPDGVTVYKDPLENLLPEFEFVKVGYPLATLLTYGVSLTYSESWTEENGTPAPIDPPIHGGGLIPGYYSKGLYERPGGVLYIPKCGVEITERARCVLTAPGEQLGTTGPVLHDTWATCCTECPTGYRCLFAGDPLDGTTIGDNPLP